MEIDALQIYLQIIFLIWHSQIDSHLSQILFNTMPTIV